MPPRKKTGPESMLTDAVKERDAVQRDLDKANDKVNKATEKFATAEAAKNDAVRDRDEVQNALTEAQRLVDALAALTPGAPDPQTVEPGGVPSGEGVMTDLPTGETAPVA